MENWQGTEALILSGAPETHIAYVERFLHAHPSVKIVCADSGSRHLHCLQVQADLIVGDFDSSRKPDIDCELIQLVPEKDDTDTMHALQVVIDRGCSSVWIACATGGRLDHLLANLSLCEYAWERGCICRIFDAQNELSFLAPGSVSVPGDSRFQYFSIIPLDRMLTGVTITGAKYPLCNASVTRSNIYTISNEVTADAALITIAQGRAFLVRSKDRLQ